MDEPQQETIRTFPDLPYEDRLIYIGGPFFTPEQQDVIASIEGLLDERDEKYFSPREYGVIVDDPMTPQRIQRIFDMNVRMIRECNILLAITDDFDPGTMFEMGMFYAWPGFCGRGSNIITYSPKAYGANVMIAQASFTHSRNMEELEHALNGHIVEDLEVTE